MLHKSSFRVFLALAIAVVLAFAIIAVPKTAAHAQTSVNTTTVDDACSSYPAGAQQPVSCYWDTVTEVTGTGTSLACVSLPPDGDNPLGYYTAYTYYYGWSYVDANGITFYGWFADGQSGPYTIVGTYSWIECGTGA